MKATKLIIGKKYLFTDKSYGYFDQPQVVILEAFAKNFVYVINKNRIRMWVYPNELDELKKHL